MELVVCSLLSSLSRHMVTWSITRQPPVAVLLSWVDLTLGFMKPFRNDWHFNDYRNIKKLKSD